MSSPVPLSPSAQAVKDAVLATYSDSVPRDDVLWALEKCSAVAVLRAAADQVVPVCDTRCDRGVQQMKIRRELLAIAAELEGGNRVEASAAFVKSLLEGEGQ